MNTADNISKNVVQLWGGARKDGTIWLIFGIIDGKSTFYSPFPVFGKNYVPLFSPQEGLSITYYTLMKEHCNYKYNRKVLKLEHI